MNLWSFLFKYSLCLNNVNTILLHPRWWKRMVRGKVLRDRLGMCPNYKKNHWPFTSSWGGSKITGVYWLVGFPDSSVGKESACNVGDLGLIPGLGRSPGEGQGYPLQYSGLENSMDCIVHFTSLHSAYKLNKHGDNIQPWCTPFPILNKSIVPFLVLTVVSWPAYRLLRRQIMS